ncbi:MAG: glycosyltransferase [Bacteroidales bacterium]|jgi:glycosyltransferase involved in cell wall biosynthesis|nr:glycosyltransferase [Bacteroidales bacterium]
MQLSIIVCTYNREDCILEALLSLKDQTMPAEDYEIVLVDNNSTDSTPEICRQFIETNPELNIQFVRERRQGLSFARNTGIEKARSTIVAFLDDDAIASKRYCTSLIQFFTATPQAMVVGGRIVPKFETEQPDWMPRELTPLYSTLDLGSEIKEFKGRTYPIGANMAFRKAVFQECGTFNTTLGRMGKNLLGGEEKDMFFRIREKRMKVFYVPEAWIYHVIPTARTTKEFIRRQAIGSGQSERLRCAHSWSKLAGAYALEIAKWGFSFLLAVKYLMLQKFRAALTLLQFRYWVSSGLFQKSSK